MARATPSLILLLAAVLPASAIAAAPPAVTPSLRSMDALTAPEGQVDSGLGVYPALAPPARLAFPAEPALGAADDFVARRGGRVAYAVADDHGAVGGRDPQARFRSASLSKAMLLVAFLRRPATDGRRPSAVTRATLSYMIRVSDNRSADQVYRVVGDAAMRELAVRAGMTRFSIDGHWSNATVTPADQVRFFLTFDRLAPPAERRFARRLLGSVAQAQSWGIPRVSRPRWRTFFKGGWRPDGGGELVHQGALLERGSRRLAIVVMTDANPRRRYGELTIEGVARALLGGVQRMLEPTPVPAPPLRRIGALTGS